MSDSIKHCSILSSISLHSRALTNIVQKAKVKLLFGQKAVKNVKVKLSFGHKAVISSLSKLNFESKTCLTKKMSDSMLSSENDNMINV